MLDADSQLLFILRRWERWHRLRRLSAWTVKGTLLGLSIGLGLSLVLFFARSITQNEFILMSLGIAAAVGALAGIAGALWRTSRLQAARLFDYLFDLEDRASTAVEILEATTGKPRLPIQALQLEDALNRCQTVKPNSDFFLNISRTQLAAFAVLLAGIGAALLFGKVTFEAAAAQRAVRSAILQEAEQIEALRQQVESDETLSPEQKEALLEELNRAVQGLREARTPEQAVSVLASAEKNLEALSNPQAQSQAEGLRNAGLRLLQAEELEQNESPLHAFAQNLSEGDALAAAQDLRNLDLNALTEAEQQDLAAQLEQTASALEDTHPGLASELRSAAQALRQGDLQAAQEALSQAAQTMTASGQQIAQARLARQAAAQAAAGEAKLLQAAANAAEAGAQNAGPVPGSEAASAAQNQGSNAPGTGSGGQGSQGAGAGQGSSDGEEGQGPEAQARPIGQNNQPGDGGLRTYEPVYAPQRLGGSGGDEVSLPGSGQPGDQVTGQQNISPGEENRSQVPYVEVLPAYAEAVRQAVEAGQVPPALRNLVKKYFSSLEP